jgi:hydroxyacid-oxoacid transhydrogenase
MWAERALRLLAGALRAAVADGTDLAARTDLALAATFAGMGFGNAGVHLPHANAYPIAGGVRDFRPAGYPPGEPLVPHGMAVALTAPAAFGFTYRADPARHLAAAELLGADPALPAADRLPAALTGLMRDVGLPNGISAVGYGPADVPDLVAGALKQQRLLATAPVPVTAADLTAIFTAALTLW